MTATLNKTPILFAALLTVATPAFAGDWRTIPGGVGNDGVCTLYNQNFECMDAARTFLASSGDPAVPHQWKMGQELHAAVTDMPEIVDMSHADPKTWHRLPRDGQVYLAEEVGFPSLFSGRTRPF